MPDKFVYGKQKFNKKYGFPKDKAHSLRDIARITGRSYKGIKQIFEKGEGEAEEKSLGSKWGWYNILFSLANDNILNIKKITELEL